MRPDELRKVNQLITRYQAEQRQGVTPDREAFLAECPEDHRWLLEALMGTTDEIHRDPDRTTAAIGRLNDLVARRAG